MIKSSAGPTGTAARPASLKDVAGRAGVSLGTVYNVLNRPDIVSPERTLAVETAIRELNYVPNLAARQLKAGSSTVLGMVIVEMGNPFYAGVALGVSKAAGDRELGLFTASSEGNPERESDYLTLFEQQRVRSILLIPASSDVSAARAVADRGMPVILLDSDDLPGFCTVGADDFAGGKLAAQHLVGQGCAHIAIVGDPTHPQVVNRHYGALAAIEGESQVRMDFLRTRAMSVIEGRRIGEELAARPARQRPDAVFATNDLLAIGLLQALTMVRTIRVPDDIAIIGYDDIEFCASAVVPLSSVTQPSLEIGAAGVQLAEAELAEGRSHTHRRRLLQPTLVIRASTSAARSRSR